MKRPPSLNTGDRIGLVAPARKIQKNEILNAISIFENRGFEVVYSEELFAEQNQFAGTDRVRAKDYQTMLDDKSIKAIISARGGYGSVRIIDKLDFSNFNKNPKWIVGYSDMTVFHNHIIQNFGIETLHASMLLNFDKNSDESLHTLFEVLSGKKPEYKIGHHQLNRFGKSSGNLCGGNLSVLFSLLGSNSFPATKGKILFIEDLDEYLYHIDRMMMGLKRAGVFEGLSGLVVGGMTEMNDNDIPFGKTAEEIIWDVIDEFDFPVCFDFPAGHIDHNLPLMMGAGLSLNVADPVTIKFK